MEQLRVACIISSMSLNVFIELSNISKPWATIRNSVIEHRITTNYLAMEIWSCPCIKLCRNFFRRMKDITILLLIISIKMWIYYVTMCTHNEEKLIASISNPDILVFFFFFRYFSLNVSSYPQNFTVIFGFAYIWLVTWILCLFVCILAPHGKNGGS